MDAKEAKRKARQQEILTAAMTLFVQKGFDGTTMDDIVSQSGISKGGLYWHFKSKDDIIAAILDQFFSQEMDAIQAILAQDGASSQRLHTIGQQIIQDITQMVQLWPISLEFYAAAVRQEHVRTVLQDYFNQYQTLFTTLIQQGIDRGEFQANITAAAAALHLLAQVEGLLLLHTIGFGVTDLAAQITDSLALFIKGLKGS